jgi:hypothetical protein
MSITKLIRPQWLIFICFAVLYTLTRTTVHGPAEDAWLMVIDITRADFINLFHPHHLLYAPFAKSWWNMWHFLGMDDAYATIQMLNCLIGSAALWQLYMLCKDMRLSNVTGIWIVSVTGVSFAVWWLSCEIETAALAFLFGLIAIRSIYSLYVKGLTTGRIIVTGIVTVIAVSAHIFHLVLGLLGLYVLLTASILDSNDGKMRTSNKRFIYSGVFLLIFTIGVLLVYSVIDLITGSNLGAVGYLVGYFETNPEVSLNLKTPLLFGVGLIRSLFGVEVLFGIPAIADMAVTYFPDKDFTDELFMVRNISVIIAYILAFLMLIITVVLGYIAVVVLKKIPKLDTASKCDAMFIIVALVTIALPSIVAGPILSGATANNEHLLLFQAMFFLGVGLVFERSGVIPKVHRIIAVSIFILLLTVNGLGSISAMMKQDNDLNSSVFQKWKEVVKPSDLMIVKLTERDAAALSYLTEAKTVNLMHNSMVSHEYLSNWIDKRHANVWIQQDMAADGVKYPSVKGFRLRKWSRNK